jgi:hypothetical protein
MANMSALQATYLDESPPSPWITIRRALDPAPLVAHVQHQRTEAFTGYRYGSLHSEGRR